MSVLRPLLFTLLLSLTVMPWAPAQTVSEVAFDGLPAGVTEDLALARIALKKDAVYDKTKESADRSSISALLQDLGYLDADTKSLVNFLPGGVRVTFQIKARNLYTIEAVKVAGLTPEATQAVLDGLKVTKETPCTQDLLDRLAQAVAPQLGINVLFMGVSKKPNANRKEVTVLLSK
jgi:outer membrane protein assembly factor BamA